MGLGEISSGGRLGQKCYSLGEPFDPPEGGGGAAIWHSEVHALLQLHLSEKRPSFFWRKDLDLSREKPRSFFREKY